MVKYVDFLKKKVPVQSLYALVGKEEYFRRKGKEYILEALEKAEEEPPFITELDGKEKIDLGTILEELRTPSMFGPRKVVILKNCEEYLEKEAAFLQYLESPSSFATLILDLTSVDGRTKLGKAIRKKSYYIECEKLYDKPPPWDALKPIYDSPLCHWIVAEVKRKGKSITLMDGYAFIERLGGDPGAIGPAIEAVISYVGKKKKKIQKEDIYDFLGVHRKTSAFDYVDHIVEGDYEKARQDLEDILTVGLQDRAGEDVTHTQTIYGMLAITIQRKIHQLGQALLLQSEGASMTSICEALQIKRFLQSKFQRELRSFSLKEIEFALNALLEAEKKVKELSVPAEEVLKDITFQLCNRRELLDKEVFIYVDG
ncbi:MAG: DNA polymerase III subunit delta [Planctomycetota bacterium]|nr:MAG: DNA polymerase III subunit delta [Planctomycetota bacterium]